MRIVFFGTPLFAQVILEYLLNQKCEIAAVVTRPDKPSGRSSKIIFSPVKQFALDHHLSLFQPPKASDPAFAEILKTFEADYFVVAAYAEILKANILEIPKIACINVHGSLLPKYRGAAPVQRSIIEGEKETGVTIMKMALQLDAGEILAVRKTAIEPNMNAGELMDHLAHLSQEVLWEVLIGLQRGAIQPIPQDHEQASYAKKLTSQEAKVDWKEPAELNHNKIRGFNPNPGAWCWVEIKGEKRRLLIKRALLSSFHGVPGEILSTAQLELIVGCGQGSLQLLEIQLEGKKQLTAQEFLRGTSLDKIKFPV